MVRGRLRCAILALIVAYALALQALLSAFVPAASVVAAASLAALCSGESADRDGMPVSHDPPCASTCIMAGCGMAVPARPGVALAAPRVELAFVPALAQAPLPPAFTGPHSARAPPLV